MIMLYGGNHALKFNDNNGCVVLFLETQRDKLRASDGTLRGLEDKLAKERQSSSSLLARINEGEVLRRITVLRYAKLRGLLYPHCNSSCPQI